MSYHIVQKIELDKENDKVFITGSDNNVVPRTPYRWHCSYYNEMMSEKRYEDVELDILEAYQSGNFQAGRQNKYTRALEVLLRMPEYEKFNWRTDGGMEYEKYREFMASEEAKKEFRAVLSKALNTKLPREKYLITKETYEGKPIYLNKRRNSRYAKWYESKAKATLFNFKDEAESLKKCFTGSENWQVVQA